MCSGGRLLRPGGGVCQSTRSTRAVPSRNWAQGRLARRISRPVAAAAAGVPAVLHLRGARMRRHPGKPSLVRAQQFPPPKKRCVGRVGARTRPGALRARPAAAAGMTVYAAATHAWPGPRSAKMLPACIRLETKVVHGYERPFNALQRSSGSSGSPMLPVRAYVLLARIRPSALLPSSSSCGGVAERQIRTRRKHIGSVQYRCRGRCCARCFVPQT